MNSGSRADQSTTREPDVALSIEEIRELCRLALIAAGATDANAEPVAASLAAAEADGMRLIGLPLLDSYCSHLRSGRIDGSATPVLRADHPGSLVIDAHCGFAHTAVAVFRTELVTTTRTLGIACLGIRNSYSAGVLGYLVESLAEEGLVVIGASNAPANVAPWGGSRRLFGTNPLAFAVPRRTDPPLVIDQATSAVTVVQLLAAIQSGKPLHAEWVLDANGMPSTDPTAFRGGGSIAPAGGHRGAMLAMIVELLAAGITGANWSYEAHPLGSDDGDPPRLGQLFIALDPEAFSNGFLTRAEELYAAIRIQPGARLPGDRRLRARKIATAQGIRIPQALYQTTIALTKTT